MDEHVLGPSSQHAPLWHSCRNAAVAAGVWLPAGTCMRSLCQLPSPCRPLRWWSAAPGFCHGIGHCWPLCACLQIWAAVGLPQHPCNHLSLDPVAEPLQEEVKLRWRQLDKAGCPLSPASPQPLLSTATPLTMAAFFFFMAIKQSKNFC